MIFKSKGLKKIVRKKFAKIGQNVIFEPGVLICHPENIEIGSDVYIGANTILEGYHQNKIIIKDRVWIGPSCYLHGAGGLTIEPNCGLGPGVKIISSAHDLAQDDLGPIIGLPLKFGPVVLGEGSDIGMGAVVLPNVSIAKGTQVGAGAVVSKNTNLYSIVAGVPAKELRIRQSAYEKREIPQKTFQEEFFSFLGHLLRYFSDLIFLLFLPLLIVYGWLRFLWKKALKIKPRILFSPLAAPLPLFAVKAIRTRGFKADNFAYDCPTFFRQIAFGLILADHPLLRPINFLSDFFLIFTWALLKYDHFEFSFNGGILAYSHLRKAEFILLKLTAKKISVYGYGSDCKVLSDVRQGPKYNNAMDRVDKMEGLSDKIIRENVRRAQKYADVLIAGGDLTHFGQKGVMLPLAADLSLWPYSSVKKHKIITLVHSTNHRSHKGTRFILKIFDELKNKLPIKMLLIERKTIKECQKLYPQGDIFIPDVISGWHGFTAIEAMAAGRPVITYLRPDIMKFHAYYAQGRIPAFSANPDTLEKAITQLVKDPRLRETLGKKGRDYALKFHSLEFVGALRSILYEYIWDGKKIDQKIFEREVKKRKLI